MLFVLINHAICTD